MADEPCSNNLGMCSGGSERISRPPQTTATSMRPLWEETDGVWCMKMFTKFCSIHLPPKKKNNFVADF